MRRLVLFLMAFALSFISMLAQDATPDTTLTITLTGTLSLISGPDCASVNGEPISVTVMISESDTPIHSTSDSATYDLPAGAFAATVGAITFTNRGDWTMSVVLGDFHDTLVFNGPSPSVLGIMNTTITLQGGSWTSAVLLHPEPFSPSPQIPRSDSKLRYKQKVSTCCSRCTTVLGITGSISNDAATSELPTDYSSDSIDGNPL